MKHKALLIFIVISTACTKNRESGLAFKNDFQFHPENSEPILHDRNYGIRSYQDSLRLFILKDSSFPTSLYSIICLDQKYPEYGFHSPDNHVVTEVLRVLTDTAEVDYVLMNIANQHLGSTIYKGYNCGIKTSLELELINRRKIICLTHKIYNQFHSNSMK